MFILCTFSKLIWQVYILHFFERKVDGKFLHFKREVDWTCLHFALFWEGKVDVKCLHFERKDDWTCLNFATFLSIQLFLSLNSIFVHPGPHKMHIKLAASLIGFKNCLDFAQSSFYSTFLSFYSIPVLTAPHKCTYVHCDVPVIKRRRKHKGWIGLKTY